MTAAAGTAARPAAIRREVDAGASRDPRRRPLWAVLLLGLSAAAAVAGLASLGAWQLERRVWKLALIERIDSRIHAAPASAPGPEAWASVIAARDEYRHVRLTGRFEPGRETLVRAATALGTGYWVLAPLRTDAGYTVLVNRGFVPVAEPVPAPPGETTVTGLVRMTEPKGGFLHSNDPAAARWYSRDVAAIAAARGLGDVAPYFVDADAAPAGVAGPVGGLTVVALPNNHLGYAFTWFGLALVLAAGTGYAAREEWRQRPPESATGRRDDRLD